MKTLYRIMNRSGVTLCFQEAQTAREAISFAKMYGHRGASKCSVYRLPQPA